MNIKRGSAYVPVITAKAPGQISLKAVKLAFLVTILVFLQSLMAAARSAPESFADLVEEISPAVVNITTTTKMSENVMPRGVVPEGSPFEDLFRDFNERGPSRPGPRRGSALGSGFVISEDGYVVTNNHVIEGADEIMVEFSDGAELSATLVGVDKNVDIAVLKVEAEGPLAFVAFGNSDVARVGDWVMAIGNPLGQGFSVSAGIISARNRELSGNYDDYIQTDAAINRGNSGGPLFNMNGDVIGVNTAILSPNGGSIGIGFSMSSNVVLPVVDQIREFGEVRRGWLGVNIGNVTDEMADALAMDEPSGAIVLDVFDGPAKAAGLQVTDVIVMFDGQAVTDSGSLVKLVGKSPVGKVVKTIVLRDGQRKTLDVILGQRPGEEAILAPAPVPEETIEVPKAELLGLTLSNITDELREENALDGSVEGLLITNVDESSDAYEKGIRAGDIITDAGQKTISDVAELEAQIVATREAGRQSVLVLVRREGQPRFVVLSVE